MFKYNQNKVEDVTMPLQGCKRDNYLYKNYLIHIYTNIIQLKTEEASRGDGAPNVTVNSAWFDPHSRK